MIDIGVALAWLVISAFSVVGLSAYARAARIDEQETELTGFPFDGWHSSLDTQAIGAYPQASAVRR
jgi:hypothetical protein